jgi:hypothetical protein
MKKMIEKDLNLKQIISLLIYFFDDLSEPLVD